VPPNGYGDWPAEARNLEEKLWEELAREAVDDEDEDEPAAEQESSEESDIDMDNFDINDDIDIADIGMGEADGDDFEMSDIDVGDDGDFNMDDDFDVENIGDEFLPDAKPDFRSRYTAVGEDVAASVCAGDFNGAMANYVTQFRISNFKPLKEHFIRCYQSAGAEIPGMPTTGFLEVPILEAPEEDEETSGRPAVPYTYASLCKMRTDALKSIDGWKNLDAGLEKFRACLYASLFTYPGDDTLQNEKINAIQQYCETYISAIRLYQKIKETSGAEQLALRCHLLTYDLHIRDRQMPLFDTIKLANKLKFYRTTSYLCREYFRLLKTFKTGIRPGFKKLAPKIKQLNRSCESKNTEAEGLVYDVKATRDEQSICPLSYEVVRVEVGKTLESTFDVDQFRGKFKGKISPTCNLCKVGARGTRL